MSCCAVTGETHCKCLYLREKVTADKVDCKALLRKLFTDHGVYTAFVLKSIVDHGKDTDAFLNRLLTNQKEIGEFVNSDALAAILTEHIKLAGAVITAFANNEPDLATKVNNFFLNADDIANVLISITKLPFDVAQQMFYIHNQFIVDMTRARLSGHYDEEQRLYDAYYNEILAMSDAIFNAI